MTVFDSFNYDGRIASFGDLSVTTAPHASKIQEYLNHPVENVKDPFSLHGSGLLSIPGKSHI